MTLLTLLLGSGHFGANIACFNLFTLPLPCWLHYFCPAQKMPCPANILLHPTEKNIWSTASKSTTAFTFIHYLMNQRNFLRAHSNCISCNRPHIDREVTIIKRSGIIGDHRLSSPPSKVCQVNQIYGQVCTMYIVK